MKKILFALAFLAAFASFLSAQDFGIDIDSSASYLSTSTASLSESNKAALWVKLPLGSVFRLDAKGNVSWSGSAVLNPSDPASLLSAYIPKTAGEIGNYFGWDIDLVKFAFSIPKPQADLASMSFAFGRYPFADQSRLVWSGKADGASFGFNYEAVQFSVDAAYTGFLFKKTTPIALTKADTDALADTSKELDKLFASPRVLYKAELSFPNVFGQAFALSAFVQEDMRAESAFLSEGVTTFVPEKGGHLDTQYLSLKASGPLFDSVYYDLSGIFGTGRKLSWMDDASSSTGKSYQYIPIYSGLGNLALSWYPSFAAGSMISLRGVLATGDSGLDSAWSSGFIPVSSTTSGLVFSPKLSNIAFGELTASTQPIPGMKLQTLAKVISFFRPTTGSISETGIKTGSTSFYLGTEADFYVIYRILSDLGLSFTLGAFIPGIDPVGAFDTSSAGFQYNAGLAVSLSL